MRPAFRPLRSWTLTAAGLGWWVYIAVLATLGAVRGPTGATVYGHDGVAADWVMYAPFGLYLSAWTGLAWWMIARTPGTGRGAAWALGMLAAAVHAPLMGLPGGVLALAVPGAWELTDRWRRGGRRGVPVGIAAGMGGGGLFALVGAIIPWTGFCAEWHWEIAPIVVPLAFMMGGFLWAGGALLGGVIGGLAALIARGDDDAVASP